MNTNEAGWDRIVRSIAGIALIVLYLVNVITGAWGIVSVVVGAVLLVTGITGVCPLYALLKVSTKKE
jgi:hypothetical protein